MKRSDLTEKILDIKREKEWSWSYIAGEIGGYSEILIVSSLLGHMRLTKPQAAIAGKLFGLSKAEIAMLGEVPVRGAGVPMPPTDPLIYRLDELVMINGPALKVLIEEQFGDGIMSAIDFDRSFRASPVRRAIASRSACAANSCRSSIPPPPGMPPGVMWSTTSRRREKTAPLDQRGHYEEKQGRRVANRSCVIRAWRKTGRVSCVANSKNEGVGEAYVPAFTWIRRPPTAYPFARGSAVP